jgi:hypothetical protein
MGTVQFAGQGPYALPVLQSSTALSVGDMVEARIRLLINSEMETLVLAMTANQATELAAYLNDAAGKSLQWQRENRKP